MKISINFMTAAEIIHFTYILQPKYTKKYKYFHAESWRWWRPHFRRTVVTQSGLLLGRGVLIMTQYAITPILVSHIGGTRLAAYSIGNSLHVLSVLFPEALGNACNLKGSEYLAKFNFSYYRKLAFSMPLIGVSISAITTIALGIFYQMIFPLFTNDHSVLNQLFENSSIFFVACFMAGAPVVFEGLVMSKQYFGYLCMVTSVALVSWIVISVLNVFIFKSLFWCWFAMITYSWSRCFGSALVIIVEEWRGRSSADGPPRGEGVPLNGGLPDERRGLINDTEGATQDEE